MKELNKKQVNKVREPVNYTEDARKLIEKEIEDQEENDFGRSMTT